MTNIEYELKLEAILYQHKEDWMRSEPVYWPIPEDSEMEERMLRKLGNRDFYSRGGFIQVIDFGYAQMIRGNLL